MAAFRYVFPILEAVLHLSSHTQLHEAALGVLGAHVTPWDPLVPREASITVLLHTLGIVPAFRCIFAQIQLLTMHSASMAMHAAS